MDGFTSSNKRVFKTEKMFDLNKRRVRSVDQQRLDVRPGQVRVLGRVDRSPEDDQRTKQK